MEAALGGSGHEAEFYPLSALLEAFEFLPLVHGFDTSPKETGAACGPRLFS